MGHKTLQGAFQSKRWGTTQCIFEGPTSEVHIIRSNAGYECSRHKHKAKWNRFYVISGKLEVVLYMENDDDITTVTDGMFTDVPPEIEHKFRAIEDTICLEIYWIDPLDPKDIVRHETDKGGVYTHKNSWTIQEGDQIYIPNVGPGTVIQSNDKYDKNPYINIELPKVNLEPKCQECGGKCAEPIKPSDLE